MRPHAHAAIAAATLALLALTACGSSEPASTGQPGPEPTATTTSPPPSPSKKQDPDPLKIGQAWKWAWEGDAEYPAQAGTTTVLGYEQPVKVYFPPDQKGYVWAALEIKVCNDRDSSPITVSQLPWSLAYKDGARVQMSGSSGGDLPKPEFPVADTAVKPGDCVRGKIPFEVPGGQRPERAVYAPEDFEQPIEWTVPAK